GPAAFLVHQADGGAGRAGELPAVPRDHLHVVERQAGGDVFDLHRVADVGVDRSRARDDLHAVGQAHGGDDVALLAVGVLNEVDVAGAVGVVFDADDGGGDVEAVALEVDDAVAALVAAADVTHGDDALVVAAAGLVQRAEQALFRRGLGDVSVLI